MVLTMMTEDTNNVSFDCLLHPYQVFMMNTSRFQQLFFISGFTAILILLDSRSAHADTLLVNSQLTNTVEFSAAPIPTPGTVGTTAASLQTNNLRAQTISPTPETVPGTTPQTIQPAPGTPSGTMQTIPETTPGTTPKTSQPIPGTTPQTIQPAPGTPSGTMQTIPETTPGTIPETSQPIPGTTPQTIQPAPGTPSGTMQTVPATTPETTPGTIQPVPGTTPQTIQPAPGTLPEAVPTQTVTLGRATRSGPSYVGIGGNIGFGGSSDLGRGSFTVFSKIGLTENLSVRPAININHDPAILLPVTLDFPFRFVSDGRVTIAPYIGGGVVISTGSDSVVRALVTGGVDVPVTDQFTANASVSIGFFGDTEVGLRLGVGYNF